MIENVAEEMKPFAVTQYVRQTALRSFLFTLHSLRLN